MVIWGDYAECFLFIVKNGEFRPGGMQTSISWPTAGKMIIKRGGQKRKDSE